MNIDKEAGEPEYLYVFDYSILEINEIHLPDVDGVDSYENTEDILTLYGLKESQCAWMYSKDKLNIEPINPIKIEL